jgi:hypothetical protein
MIPLANLNLNTYVVFPPAEKTAKIALIGLVVTAAVNFMGVPLDPKPLYLLLTATVLCASPRDISPWFACMILVATIIIEAVLGDRSYCIASVFAMFLYFKWQNGKIMRTLIILGCFLILIVYVYFMTFICNELNYITGGIFGQNTRSFLLLEMVGQMTPYELLTGRGLGGQYFSYFFYHYLTLGMTDGDSPFRRSSEVGFLGSLLKIGLFGTAMFCYVICRAQYQRFKSHVRIYSGYLNISLVLLLLFFSELYHQASFGYALWFTCCGLAYNYRENGKLIHDSVVGQFENPLALRAHDHP